LKKFAIYIARDSGTYSSIFAKKVNAIVKSIPDFPKSGRVVPEYDDDNLREKILGDKWGQRQYSVLCFAVRR